MSITQSELLCQLPDAFSLVVPLNRPRNLAPTSYICRPPVAVLPMADGDRLPPLLLPLLFQLVSTLCSILLASLGTLTSSCNDIITIRNMSIQRPRAYTSNGRPHIPHPPPRLIICPPKSC